jgi:hypothetical protein
VAATAAVAGCLALLAGCPSAGQDPAEGYSAAPLHSTKVGSVFVEMFKVHKTEFRRGYEFQLTEALAKRISAATDLKIASKTAADSILTGEILTIDKGTLSEISGDEVRESQLTVEVAVQWKDLRTGEILMEAEELRDSGEYIPSLGEDEVRAAQSAVDRLARRIVERMESQW